MEPGVRTPLVDFFRRGDVARDVRLLAARGALAPRAHEQLALLLLLLGDTDPEVAAAAEATLSSIPRVSLAGFLARSDVPAEMRDAFAGRGIEPAAEPYEADGPIIEAADDEAVDEDTAAASVATRIAAMTVAQRIATAIKGTREERAVLIRDPNRIVGVSVLSSAKITESEIESYAKMASLSEELLRIIANTRAWTKNYAVTVALARNPKTPVPIAMNLLPRLVDKDLRVLATDRNVSEVVRNTARRRVANEK